MKAKNIVSAEEIAQNKAGIAARNGSTVTTVQTVDNDKPVIDGVVSDENALKIASLEKRVENLTIQLASFNLGKVKSDIASVIGQMEKKLKDNGEEPSVISGRISMKNLNGVTRSGFSVKSLSEKEVKAYAYALSLRTKLTSLLSDLSHWSEKSKY